MRLIILMLLLLPLRAVSHEWAKTTVVADPVVSWNTFVGSARVDAAYALALDGSGNVYIAGESDATWGSPVDAHGGEVDGFVAKFDSTGKRLWNTFVGSTEDDSCYAVAVDGSGNVYAAGCSGATWGSPLNAFAGGTDGFVVKLDPSGNRVWLAFVGSAAQDECAALALDGSGAIVAAGSSEASWGTPLYAHAGGRDGFVVKLSAAGSRSWSTFLGSPQQDDVLDVAVDASNNIYVAGVALATWGSPVRAHSGNGDAFVAKLDSSGQRTWNTFLGCPDTDGARAIVVDATGNAFVVGDSYDTWGSPVSAQAGDFDAFLAKLDSSGNLLWHTFVGGPSTDRGQALCLRSGGQVLVSGRSQGTWGTPASPFKGGDDAFLANFDSSGQLLWNAFLGSEDADACYALAADSGGNSFLAGQSNGSWNTPVVAHSGQTDGFLAKVPDSAISNRPPTVAVTLPLNHATVHGMVQVKAEAADEKGVDRVEFYVSGQLKGTDRTVPYSYSWETCGYSAATYELKAKAYDVGGLSAEDAILISVQNLDLELKAERRTDRAWMLRKQYGQVEFATENWGGCLVDKYVIYRKVSGSSYRVLAELKPADLSDGKGAYQDAFLEKDKTYTYKLEVWGDAGLILAKSGEVTI